MTLCVVDASIFGPLFFVDETDDLLGGLPALLTEQQCLAPAHWRLELTNLILMGGRRKRLLPEEALIAIGQIACLEVEIDEDTWRRHGDVYRLAYAHGLSAYDAGYLELAMRKSAVLATYDKALRCAAQAEQIELLPT